MLYPVVLVVLISHFKLCPFFQFSSLFCSVSFSFETCIAHLCFSSYIFNTEDFLPCFAWECFALLFTNLSQIWSKLIAGPPWSWFSYRSLPVKSEFFIPTVAKCVFPDNSNNCFIKGAFNVGPSELLLKSKVKNPCDEQYISPKRHEKFYKRG